MNYPMEPSDMSALWMRYAIRSGASRDQLWQAACAMPSHPHNDSDAAAALIEATANA